MALLDDVKSALRIMNNDFDDEVLTLINAAKTDLETTGITVKEDDALTVTAITFYAKAHFGWDNSESDRLLRNYNALKNKLAMTSEYNGSEADES